MPCWREKRHNGHHLSRQGIAAGVRERPVGDLRRVLHGRVGGGVYRGDAEPGARSFPGTGGVLPVPGHRPAGGERRGLDVQLEGGVRDIFHELPPTGAGRTQVADGCGINGPRDGETVLERHAFYLPRATRLHEGGK